jgi:hypothetical protein
MRTLVRYSGASTLSIFVGTLIATFIESTFPSPVTRSFLGFWFIACVAYAVVIWLSAAATREGRSSAAPWLSGLAAGAQVVFFGMTHTCGL